MILIVTGSRDASETWSRGLIRNTIIALGGVDEIWHGKCPTGADAAAEEIVSENNLIQKVRHFPADWNTYGKAAGPIRNEYMMNTAKNEVKEDQIQVLAILAYGATNKGTRGTIEIAMRYQFKINIRWVRNQK